MAKDSKAGRASPTDKGARQPAKDRDEADRAKEYERENERVGREWTQEAREVGSSGSFEDDEDEELDEEPGKGRSRSDRSDLER